MSNQRGQLPIIEIVFSVVVMFGEKSPAEMVDRIRCFDGCHVRDSGNDFHPCSRNPLSAEASGGRWRGGVFLTAQDRLALSPRHRPVFVKEAAGRSVGGQGCQAHRLPRPLLHRARSLSGWSCRWRQ